MRLPTAILPLVLLALASAAACDRPTAPQLVGALARRDADPLAGATGAYYTSRFGFDYLLATAMEPGELLVSSGGRTEVWEAIAIERRYVRDSVAGRPCPDVWRSLVAIRDEERAVIEMAGADFAQPIAPWEWCGNDDGNGSTGPYLYTVDASNVVKSARTGTARLEVVAPREDACVFRGDPRNDRYRVDCERVEMRVAFDVALSPVGEAGAPEPLRAEPQVIPGLRLTVHCNAYASDTLALGGCMTPSRR